MRLISVAVPVPALGLLTYAVPEHAPMPPAGARVLVPLGTRQLTGLVLGEGTPVDEGIETRELLDVLDRDPFLPSDVLDLAAWVADYYLAGPGAALAAALPPHALTARVDAFKTVRVATLTDRGEAIKVWRAAVDAGGHGQPGEVLSTLPGALRVACGEGALELVELQRPGGRRVSARQAFPGGAPAAGQRLPLPED